MERTMKMPNLLIITFAVFLLSPLGLASVFAQTLSEEAQSLLDELGNVKEKMRVAENEQASLEKEKKNLSDTDKLLKQAEANAQKDLGVLRDDLSRKKMAEQQLVDRGCRPGEQSSNKPLVEGCNEEIERLNVWDKQLTERAKTIKMTAGMLTTDRKNLSEATLAWAQKVKANNNHLLELKGRYDAIQARLTGLNVEKACKKLLNSPYSPEEIKLKCGNVQFDNMDPNLPPLDK